MAFDGIPLFITFFSLHNTHYATLKRRRKNQEDQHTALTDAAKDLYIALWRVLRRARWRSFSDLSILAHRLRKSL